MSGSFQPLGKWRRKAGKATARRAKAAKAPSRPGQRVLFLAACSVFAR